MPPKYICVCTVNDTAMNNFQNDLSETDIASILSSDLTSDPNSEYAQFERIMTTAYEKHFSENRVKFNKHKHELSDWITSGILKYIEFRDKQYRRLNKLSTDSPDYELVKYSLKIYNRYLNQCIHNAKKIIMLVNTSNIKAISGKLGIHWRTYWIRKKGKIQVSRIFSMQKWTRVCSPKYREQIQRILYSYRAGSCKLNRHQLQRLIFWELK